MAFLIGQYVGSSRDVGESALGCNGREEKHGRFKPILRHSQFGHMPQRKKQAGRILQLLADGQAFGKKGSRLPDVSLLDGQVAQVAQIGGQSQAVIEGAEENVAAMRTWLHTGSPMSTVTDVELTDEEPGGEQGFAIRY